MNSKNLIKGKPLRFGDPKQIEFVRRKDAQMNELLTSGIDMNSKLITIDVIVQVKFHCFQCDHIIDSYEAEEYNTSPNNEVYSLITQDSVICPNCKNEYYFENGIITN